MPLALLTLYLPAHPGLLPKWLLFILVVSVFNSVQTYLLGPTLTRRVYEAQPAETTGLLARTFGTWTVISAIIRFYGAYHVSNQQVYELTLALYLVALAHFGSEWFYYGTAKWGKGIAGPAIVATTSVVWMTTQKNFYVGL